MITDNRHMTPSRHILLEGTFDAVEAEEILLALLEAKITYHSRRVFSSIERFGVTDDASEARLVQLRATRTAICEHLARATADGTTVRVHSVIELHPLAAEPTTP